MNKLKIYFVGAVIAMTGGRVSAQTMTFGDVDLKAGETDTMRISLMNPTPISAWQMKFYLPKGLSLAKSAISGEWMFSLSSRHAKGFIYAIDPRAIDPRPEDGCVMLSLIRISAVVRVTSVSLPSRLITAIQVQHLFM